MFDSGASHSILKLATAARAGIKPDSPGVVSGGGTGGIGRRRVATWIARFGSLDLGGELIQNARLRIGDIELAEADFLLGADFFLSHRILFAKSQGKVYLTYNGGRVFDLSVIPAADTVTAQDSTVPPAESNTTNSAEAPADAAGYRRRGAALAGRGDLAGAIGDLDQAIRLDPADPENFYQRALAHLRNRNVKLATADLDRAIELRATYVDALKERASLRFANQDEVGALADYDAVVGASPADSGAELNIAKTYIDAGKYAGAVHFFDRWVDTHATDQHRAEVLNNRCWTRAMLNQQLELAMADCNASLKLQFGPAPLDSRALVYLRMGDFAHSIADYKFSLARRPSNASSLYGKGLAELRQGNKAQGQKDIDAAVALAPRIAEQFNFVGLTP